MDVVLCRIVRSLILSFHVACSSGTAPKFTEKRDARSELLFFGLNPLLFSCSRCGRRHLLGPYLRSDDVDGNENVKKKRQ